MIMNDFDDERTMEEEEALQAEDEDEADELSALEQEQVTLLFSCLTILLSSLSITSHILAYCLVVHIV